MLKGFLCPSDNLPIEFSECLKDGGCRAGSRCCSRSSLKLISQVRPFNKENPKFSTTQLINGTMYEFLRITRNYYESPFDSAFKIIGTRAHKGLEMQKDELSLIEERFEEQDVTGTADFLEIEDGFNTLGDHKVSGWYKVMKAVGWKAQEVETDEVYKSGAKKGQKKKKKIYIKGEPDCRDWALQLNRYRIYFENAGFKVDRIKIESIVRDYKVSPRVEGRYLLNPIEYFDIERLGDREVLDYFDRKKTDLEKALKDNNWSEPCDETERWDDRRCKSYCPVNWACQYYLDKVKEQEDEKEE